MQLPRTQVPPSSHPERDAGIGSGAGGVCPSGPKEMAARTGNAQNSCSDWHEEDQVTGNAGACYHFCTSSVWHRP